MAAFRHRAFLKIARSLGVFLNFEVGLTRNTKQWGALENLRTGELEKARKQIAEQRQQLSDKDREIHRLKRVRPSSADAGASGRRLTDGNLIWVLGGSRTGSTWLGSMMGDIENHALWQEPLIGKLFGDFYYKLGASKRRHEQDSFIMGRLRDSWLRSIRFFVLEGAEARFPELSSEGYVVIKEPNGSIGAPLLTEALPESRMVMLIRDPRDVAASRLEAMSEGGWRHKQLARGGQRASIVANPDDFVKDTAEDYLQSMGNSKIAYEAHCGPSVLVKYEELRENPLETMKRLYSGLKISVDETELNKVVEKHSWENIPGEKKGEGKFYRKAEPGSWREDLSSEQVKMIEEKTAPLLREFYPD